MNRELQSEGRTEMTRAPYSAPDFRFAERDDAWMKSDSARVMGEAVITYQTPSGGWSKRTDMTHPRARGMSYYSETDAWHYSPTFDNGATTGQLRFLSALSARHADPRYATAFARGLRLILEAQQPNGCWPQSYPLEGGYHDAATFNDDATTLVMRVLDDVSSGVIPLGSPADRRSAPKAAKRGVDCLLASQVAVNGRRTVWGQQHDPITLAIVPARRYELAGLAGRESASVITYLMSLERPTAEVVASVHAAAAWFRAHALTRYRYDAQMGLRVDPEGQPIWARLTEVATDKPIFANRDGVKLYDWNQLTDRRSGYGWFGTEPAAALTIYDSWSRTHPEHAPSTLE